MKKVFLRSLTVFLAMVFCLSFVSCANEKKSEETASTTYRSEVTETTAESTLYEADGLPEKMEFGQKLVMLYDDEYWNVDYFVEGEPINIVESAIDTRNKKATERLGVTVEYIGTPGSYNHKDDYLKKVRTSMESGDCYDILGGYSMSVANCAYNGFCTNLLDYQAIDFKKPWWPKSLIDEATINDKLYFASGDISTNMLYTMYTIFFNKEIAQNNNLEDPYQLVIEGKWTIDKLIELTKIATPEGQQKENMVYGFTSSAPAHTDSFFFGAGLRTVEHDGNGGLTVSPLFGGERALNTVEKVSDFLALDYCAVEDGDEFFAQGRNLFFMEMASYAGKTLGDSDVKYGVLPIPKYDELQDDYRTCTGFGCVLYAITSNSKNIEAASYLLEALASESYRTVTPALFEVTMKVRYADDPTTAKMFDILRAGVSFDAGRIFCSSFGNITYSMFRNGIVSHDNYAQTFKTNQNSFKIKLKVFSEKFGK